MISRTSYSEPLRSYMRRRWWSQVVTVGSVAGLAIAIGIGGFAIGHAILKTALIVTAPTCMGCF